MEAHHLCIALIAAVFIWHDAAAYVPHKFAVYMPHVNPHRDELYVCTPLKIVKEKSFYVVGFEPNATMNMVHHMILFGCTDPGLDEDVWDCGEMGGSTPDRRYKSANPCKAGTHVLYAWARNAEPLILPEDVGFQIGEGTGISYLVLQLHYAHKSPENVFDSSGVNLIFTETPQPKLAGVLLLASGGTIPAHRETHMEPYCAIEEDKVIHPFAFRVHTHALGKVVSGYHVTQDQYGEDKWTLLGKRNPMQPQMFYATNSTAPIRQGEVVAARCTMVNFRDVDTRVGPTNLDEMCNFYLMYYVNHDKPLNQRFCWSEGPPYQFWSTASRKFRNVPEDVSSL